MKLLVGYPIWNRVDMLAYLLDGIVRHLDPSLTELAFVFDNPEDGSDEAFHHLRKYWLEEHTPFKCKHWVVRPDRREVGCHNDLLRYFYHETDADMLLIPQDDIRFKANPLPAIEEVARVYGDKLGVVGSRCGYDWGGVNMAGSWWSKSNPEPTIRLKHGEYTDRAYLNTGPLAYPRRTVRDVGVLDEQFHAWYAWDDYCRRTRDAGLTNVVLGLDLIHHAFGRLKATEFYGAAPDGRPWSELDLYHLVAKHGSGKLASN